MTAYETETVTPGYRIDWVDGAEPTEWTDGGSPACLGPLTAYYAPATDGYGRDTGGVLVVTADHVALAAERMDAADEVERYRIGAVLTGETCARYLAGDTDGLRETWVDMGDLGMGVWVPGVTTADEIEALTPRSAG